MAVAVAVILGGISLQKLVGPAAAADLMPAHLMEPRALQAKAVLVAITMPILRIQAVVGAELQR